MVVLIFKTEMTDRKPAGGNLGELSRQRTAKWKCPEAGGSVDRGMEARELRAGVCVGVCGQGMWNLGHQGKEFARGS